MVCVRVFVCIGRTELFLEVYGNALIQEKTQLYINRKVKDIRK